MGRSRATSQPESITLSESSRILKKLMAAFQNQSWADEAVELWSSRILSWVNQYGARNVDSTAEWAIDCKEDLHNRQIDISIFRARLSQRDDSGGDKSGQIVMCLLCQNSGFYAVEPANERSRYARCPHPTDKQQAGWRMERGVTIPPGESLKSMRDNYNKFIDLVEKLKHKKTPHKPVQEKATA